jgi:hypothetical protein
VKRFRDAVAQEPKLKNNAELEDLRKKLLKEPLAFFRSLREQLQADRDTRPESLVRLASEAFELGSLRSDIGNQQDTLRAFQEALAICERLARENPSVTKLQHAVAVCHFMYCHFARTNRQVRRGAGRLRAGSGDRGEAGAPESHCHLIPDWHGFNQPPQRDSAQRNRQAGPGAGCPRAGAVDLRAAGAGENHGHRLPVQLGPK